MGRSLEFIHIMVTSYHCSPCKKKFICKKTFTKRDKQKRKEENKHTGKPVCFLYGIECTRPFPRTQKEFGSFESKTRITLKAIKELFDDSSIFIEKIKTTSLLAKVYSEKKMYNHCKKHKDCKCDYYDLSKICEYCDETCIHSLEDYRLQEYEAIVKGNKMLVDGAIPLEVFKYNVEKIYEDLQQEKKKETYRFWRLVIFYLFGPGGSGKTGLVQELFSDELSDKPKKQQSGSNWWNGYEDQEIVLIDEFYTKIDWENMGDEEKFRIWNGILTIVIIQIQDSYSNIDSNQKTINQKIINWKLLKKIQYVSRVYQQTNISMMRFY
ncbi:6408_t:CDS:2 [Gigaspora rosea]|nr:6408_t:CDS:2 [Gigaspora rosea]